MERRVEAVADVAGARKLVQRLQIHELGRALALAAASRESLVHFTWNGFLQWPQLMGLVSRLMVRLHRWQDCLGDCGRDWLVFAVGCAACSDGGRWILQSQDGLGL